MQPRPLFSSLPQNPEPFNEKRKLCTRWGGGGGKGGNGVKTTTFLARNRAAILTVMPALADGLVLAIALQKLVLSVLM